MAKCKDCLHVEVCREYVMGLAAARGVELDATEIEQVLVSDDCDNFKGRSRFVELPCKVGDTVYFNNVHLRYAKVIAIYIDASGGMFDLDISTNIETVAGYEHFINKDYTFEDIGKRLFLTKEAAEQALRGYEKCIF